MRLVPDMEIPSTVSSSRFLSPFHWLQVEITAGLTVSVFDLKDPKGENSAPR